MDKKAEQYERAEIIITEFDQEDVITTSSPLDKYEGLLL